MSVRNRSIRGRTVMVRNWLFAFLFVLTPNAAYASPLPSDYVCKILDVKKLSDGGRIIADDAFTFTIGMEFGVVRETGEIIGKTLSNQNANGSPKVLDIGSDRQAFKAITIYEPFVSVSYLMIKEYEDGSDKPFIFYDVYSTYSGLCRHPT